MKRVLIAVGIAALTTGTADAATLLDLIDAPGQVNTPYSFDIVTTKNTLSISFAGYQKYRYENANTISLAAVGGSNILSSDWDFSPAAIGSFAFAYSGGASLSFGGIEPGYYDTFSQTVTVTPGVIYTLTFNYSNAGDIPTPSALRVTDDTSAVPEPASWALMLCGFGVVGAAMRRRATSAAFA